jgi:hypothetical protein
MYKHFDKISDPKMIGVSDKLMSMLDNARTIADVPFIITSGLRTVESNKKTGGVPDSAHLKGLAVDLACSDSFNRYKIIYGLFVGGFKRIGIAKDHIHADIDETKDQFLIFLE